jgi:hypothetical protein
LSSGKKKIKIEIEDDDGGKYNLSLEGNISKTKLMKAIDFMGLINGNSDKDNRNNDLENNNRSIYNSYKNRDSVTNEFEEDESDHNIPSLPSSVENSSSLTSKIWSLIESRLSKTSFTSSDIVLLYKREYNEHIGLDKVATYLARYCEKGRLERSKRTKEWLYKLASPKPKAFNNDLGNSNHRDNNVVHKYYPSSNQIQATDFN